jgi:hypothetical protein
VRAWLLALFAGGACFVALGGCAKESYGGVASVLPTAFPSPASSSAACQQAATANAQVIAISPLITPTNNPAYGIIAGYGPVTGGSAANVAAPILVLPGATVQFFDNDQLGSQLTYSAAGIPNVTAFPSPSYTFPPSAIAATGNQISASTVWSTGLLAGQCYSQIFTVPSAGTYYFGDYTYYGLGNVRDVIVAATATPVH